MVGSLSGWRCAVIPEAMIFPAGRLIVIDAKRSSRLRIVQDQGDTNDGVTIVLERLDPLPSRADLHRSLGVRTAFRKEAVRSQTPIGLEPLFQGVSPIQSQARSSREKTSDLNGLRGYGMS